MKDGALPGSQERSDTQTDKATSSLRGLGNTQTTRQIQDRQNGGPIVPQSGKQQEISSDTASGGTEKSGSCRAVVNFAYAALPEWLHMVAVLSLIFGGCCANVFALEAIVKKSPGSGTLITCVQFILTSLFTLSSHLDLSRGLRHFYLKPRAIPFKTWVIYTAFFLTINVLNNKAFEYKISVPLHIILRSAGPVATLAVGYVSGRRYTERQILAVALLFLGVVQAAVADAQAKGAEIRMMSIGESSTSEFFTGFGILYLALVLSAIMGVFTDKTYAKYGRTHTEENLFYSHSLSLPFFLFRWADLRVQSQALLASPPLTTFAFDNGRRPGMQWFHTAMARTPVQLVFLLMNATTQYLCIRGVNQLSAQSSSLTVSIVLNMRKLVSLLFSIWLFGNRLAPGVLVGAAVVFIGGAVYALPSQRSIPPSIRKENKKEM